MSFQEGEKIFGKMRGYPPWPGKIMERKGKNQYVVTFYPKGDRSILKAQDISPFFSYLPQLKILKRNKSFNLSIKAIFQDLTEMELIKVKNIDKAKVFQEYYSYLCDNIETPITDGIEEHEGEMEQSDQQNIDQEQIGQSNKDRVDRGDLTPHEIRVFQVFKEIAKINKAIKKSLRFKQPPELDVCLQSLESLKELHITRSILLSYPDIVRTVNLMRRYHIMKSAYPALAMKELQARADLIRTNANITYMYFKVILDTNSVTRGTNSVTQDTNKVK